jgi:hypothetical protein
MYRHQTKIGTFYIRYENDRGWRVGLDNEDLGGYPSPQSALSDLVGGHTHWPGSGVDPSTLGIPDELSEWSRTAS